MEDVRKCGKCGADVDINDMYCPECGAERRLGFIMRLMRLLVLID